MTIWPGGANIPSAKELRISSGLNHFLTKDAKMAVFLGAIAKLFRALNHVAFEEFRRSFDKLPIAKRYELLKQLQNEELAGFDLPQKAMFSLLHRLVLEAALGDPYYGGNEDQAAWRAIGFRTPNRRIQ